MTRPRRRRQPRTPCADCGAETLSPELEANEFYIVRDEVWQAAGMTYDGYLCIGCLEARLGRQLHRRDFPRHPFGPPVPVNDLDPRWSDYAWWWRSDRLADRLTRPDPADGVQAALWEDP